jgi:4-oxalocrotonate tautomerase
MPFIQVAVSSQPNPNLARTLAHAVTERAVRILGSLRERVALDVSFVPKDQWFVGGETLEELGVSSYWLEIRVTEGRNTTAQKAEYLSEIHALMGRLLGELHPVSYAHVHEAVADAWGFGGVSQAERAHPLEAGHH